VSPAAAASVGIAFVCGGLPFGPWIFRLARGADLRAAGSRNPGASNVFREAGLLAGAATLLLDAGKGTTGVVLASALSDDPGIPGAAALAAVLGHVYSPWLRFRGGRGAATTAGAFAPIFPLPVAGALALFAGLVLVTRRASAATLGATAAFAAALAVVASGRPGVWPAWAACGLILWRHRENMARLRRGEEPRLDGTARADGGDAGRMPGR
jgi:glycerol-3-phosphate acyltransferase PlsY